MGTLSTSRGIATDGLVASLVDPHLTLLAVLVGMWVLDRLFGALGTGRGHASDPAGSADATDPTPAGTGPNRHRSAGPNRPSGAELDPRSGAESDLRSGSE